MGEEIAGCVEERLRVLRNAGERSLEQNPSWWRRLNPPDPELQIDPALAQLPDEERIPILRGVHLFPGDQSALIQRVCEELRPLAEHFCKERRAFVVDDRRNEPRDLFDDCLLYVCVRDAVQLALPDWIFDPGADPTAYQIPPAYILLDQMLQQAIDATFEHWAAAWLSRSTKSDEAPGEEPAARKARWNVSGGLPAWEIYLHVSNTSAEAKEELAGQVLEQYVLEPILMPEPGQRPSYWDYTFQPRKESAKPDFRPFGAGLRSLVRRRCRDLLSHTFRKVLDRWKRLRQTIEDGTAEPSDPKVQQAMDDFRKALGELFRPPWPEQLEQLSFHLAHAIGTHVSDDTGSGLQRLLRRKRALWRRAEESLSEKERDRLNATNPDHKKRATGRLFEAVRRVCRGEINRLLLSDAAGREIAWRELLDDLARSFYLDAEAAPPEEDVEALMREDPSTTVDEDEPADGPLDAEAGRLGERLVRLVELCYSNARLPDVIERLTKERPTPGQRSPFSSLFAVNEGVVRSFALCVAYLLILLEGRDFGGESGPAIS